MKKFKVFGLIIIVAVMVGVSVLVGGCGSFVVGRAQTNHFLVYVYEKYYDRFDERNFSCVDFGWNNVKEILYFYFPETATESEAWRFLSIVLLNPGTRVRDRAMRHFETLYFVRETKVSYQARWWIDIEVGYLQVC